jgi:hypothetical protein
MRLAAPITRSADALASSSHHVHAWDLVSGDAFGPPLEALHVQLLTQPPELACSEPLPDCSRRKSRGSAIHGS